MLLHVKLLLLHFVSAAIIQASPFSRRSGRVVNGCPIYAISGGVRKSAFEGCPNDNVEETFDVIEEAVQITSIIKRPNGRFSIGPGTGLSLPR